MLDKQYNFVYSLKTHSFTIIYPLYLDVFAFSLPVF